MKTILLTLSFACFCAAQPKPFEVAVSVNAGAQTKVYKGWPLVVRADAALSADTEQPVSLDAGSLRLSIFAASGEALSLPFERMTALDAGPQLHGDNDCARVIWLLRAEETAAVPPGAYAIGVSWGGVDAPIRELEVADAPAELSKQERLLLVRLRAESAALGGDNQGAIALIDEGLAADPSTISLLTQKASSQIALRQFREALGTVQDALEEFEAQFPGASHPPYTILQLKSRILESLEAEVIVP